MPACPPARRRRQRFGRLDQALFERYLDARRLRIARIARPQPDDGEPDLFAVSLYSTRIYWANCFKARSASGEPFRVMPGYVADAGLNAFADIEADLHLCVVNIGLAAALFELACFCLAQADVLTAIGNAGSELSPRATDAPGFTLPQRLVIARNGMPEFSMLPLYFPRDPARQAAAYYLALLMLRFVWFHELYHCLNGHVRYFCRGTALRLDEIQAPSAPTDAFEEQRVLELDADQSAFFVCATIQHRGTENIEGIKALDRAMRLKLTLFGAYLTTWMFDEQARRTGLAGDRTHPAPYLRLHNLLRCAAAYLADDIPELPGVHRELLQDLARLIPLAGSPFSPSRIMADMQSAAFQAQLDAYDDRNAVLQPHYHRFGYR